MTTVRNPDCPIHGDVALRLALGELDGEAATAAENTLATCHECAEWYRTALALPAVADGVAAGLNAYFARRRAEGPPAASRGRLAALAAGLLLLFAGATLWRHVSYSGLSTPRHEGETGAWSFVVEPAPASEERELIFHSNLESSSLAGWTAVVQPGSGETNTDDRL